MLRVNVGLSRKLSKDYNSTGYSINLEGEVTALVSDPEAVMEQVKELYSLAEGALDQQIERAQSELAICSRDVEPQIQASAPPHNGNSANSNSTSTPQNGNGKSNGNGQKDEPATTKQVQFLLSIGKRQELTTTDLEQKIAETLNRKVGIYELSKRDAAKVLDVLTGQPSNGRAYARR